MHPEKQCGKCRYACHFVARGKIESTLLCKRFPPRLTFMGVQPNGQMVHSIMSTTVDPMESWCHEFAPGEPLRESQNTVEPKRIAVGNL